VTSPQVPRQIRLQVPRPNAGRKDASTGWSSRCTRRSRRRSRRRRKQAHKEQPHKQTHKPRSRTMT